MQPPRPCSAAHSSPSTVLSTCVVEVQVAAAADPAEGADCVPSTSSGSSVVSPRPQTKRGRTITASSAPPPSSSTTCSAIAFERE